MKGQSWKSGLSSFWKSSIFAQPIILQPWLYLLKNSLKYLTFYLDFFQFFFNKSGRCSFSKPRQAFFCSLNVVLHDQVVRRVRQEREQEEETETETEDDVVKNWVADERADGVNHQTATAAGNLAHSV